MRTAHIDITEVAYEYRHQWRSPKSLRIARVAAKFGLTDDEVIELVREGGWQ
jgi:hypothetical protein